MPVDRAGTPDRELEPVPVLQLQPPKLVVRLPAVVQQRIGDRQERGLSLRRHGELRLVQPGVHRDLPRRHPVVAQRDLDQAAVRSGSSCRSMRSTTLSLSGISVVTDSPRSATTIRLGISTGVRLYRRIPRLVPLRRGHRLVHAPRRGHGERLQVVGDLAAQPHRRGDHQAALLRRVLQAGVLVGPGAAVVNLGQRNAPAGFGVVRVPDIGIGLARVRVLRIAGAGRQLERRDPPDQVDGVGRAVDDLLGAVHRAEEFPFEDVGQVLAGRPGTPVRLVLKPVLRWLDRRAGRGHSSSPSSSSSAGGGASPWAAARRRFSSRSRSRISTRAAGLTVQRRICR